MKRVLFPSADPVSVKLGVTVKDNKCSEFDSESHYHSIYMIHLNIFIISILLYMCNKITFNLIRNILRITRRSFD